MHVSTHSTNLNFSVPVTSNTQLHQASVSVLECREPDQQHIAGNCDTEDEIPATVISSVGTINYHQSAQSHQLFVVASGNHHTGAAVAAASGSTTAAKPHTAANDHCNAIYAMAATAATTMDGMQQDPANTNLNNINHNNNYCNTISNIVITSSSQLSISSAMTATDGAASANSSSLTSLNAQATATATAMASHLPHGKDGPIFTSGWRQHPSDEVSTANTSSATNQPRLHPKKRKINPAEYEEMEPTGGSDTIQHDEKGSQQQQQQLQDCSGSSAFNATNNNSFLQRSNKNWYESGDASSTATMYSSIIRMAGPSTTHSTMMTATAPAPLTVAATTAPSASTSTDDTLDLSEWCNHRVLAKQEDIYVAGIIRSVDKNNTILVEFDYPEGTRQTYYNVLGAGRFDVISDASPSAGDLILGSRVCIRIQSPDRPGNVFVEGAVVEIYNDTKQFLVQITNAIGGNDEYLKVKRGQIRLLRPPWWDELNDCDEFVSNTVVQMTAAAAAKTSTTAMGDNGGATKQSHCSSNDAAGPIFGGANSAMPNSRPAANHRLKYITNVEQGTPFQLHHVLPTLQVSALSVYHRHKDKKKFI